MAKLGTKISKDKHGCATIVTRSDYTFPDKFSGRKVTFKVCAVKNGIHITRGGRRGGARRDPMNTARGGMLTCTAEGTRSKCLRGKDFVAMPGGSAKMRSWETGKKALLNGFAGYSKSKKRRR